jgi:hypothetical protein
MTVDYEGALSNDENRDAFFKYHEFTVTGAQTEVIELKRPFAQLNIGTNDYQASKDAGYAPAYSYVKIPVYSTLNLATGAVDGIATKEFALAAVPQGENFPVAGYEYLSMNYLLVAADKEVVDLTFGYSENNTTVEKSRIVGSVPVQRNHRTNIYGQLFTSDVDFNVIINPEYEEPDYELDSFYHVITFGGEYNATADVNMAEKYLTVQENATINMNGETLKVAEGQGAGYGALITNGVQVTFNEANIVSGGAGINVQSGAKVEINGGSIHINSDYTGQRYVIYAAQPGTVVTINGGKYSFENTYRKISYICAHLGAKVYVTGGEFGAPCTHPNWKLPIYTETGGEVIITGGTFGFDPTEWVADGYEATQSGSTWTVAAK